MNDNWIKRSMPFMITGIMIVTLLIVQFTIIYANTEIKINELITNIVVNTAILVIMATTWSSSGRMAAKTKENTPYYDNKKAYAGKISAISSNGQHNMLDEFCKQKTEELRTAKIIELLNDACIDYTVYIENYAVISLAQIRKLKLERRQKSILVKVRRGKIKIKTAKASDITADCKSHINDGYGLDYDERADTAMRTTVKAARSIVSGLVLAVMAIQLSQNITDITAWAFFCIKLILVIVNAWTGYNDGYSQIAETKNKVIVRRIMFLNTFDEWIKDYKPQDTHSTTNQEQPVLQILPVTIDKPKYI